jgi:hypothetical protein
MADILAQFWPTGEDLELGNQIFLHFVPETRYFVPRPKDLLPKTEFPSAARSAHCLEV